MEFAVAISAALLGLILGLFASSYLSWRANQVASINDHISDLEELERLGQTYWLDERPPSQANAAEKIRGKLHAMNTFPVVHHRIIASRRSEYLNLQQEIYELLTDGDFQTNDAERDPKRVVALMRKCIELRDLLRGQRGAIYWAH